MNLDELKTIWKRYDEQLERSKHVNDQLILSVIRERSHNRFQTVRKNYRLGLVWMLFCLGIGFAVLLGNPFDYTHWLQYVPMVIFVVCLAIMIVNMMRSYLALESISIERYNLSDALRQIIGVYEKPKRFINGVIILFLLSQTVLFPLSFLPKSVDKVGLGMALSERLIPISIAVGVFFLAKWLGAFKDRNGPEFRDDLNELMQLKKIAGELEAE